MICPECIKKDKTLQKIAQAWKESKEADRHYGESTETKAEAVGKAVHLEELMNALENPSQPIASCDHADELGVLRDIARVAGDWGIAMAELQVDPTRAHRRTKAAKLAREMSELLGLYKQMQGERN